MKICRDDLRYTDDVIATLQSDNPRWYIAKALNIPKEDVEYHYEEVRGMKHNGTLITLSNATQFTRYPTDASWYLQRTRHQIAEELGKDYDAVKQYIRTNKLITRDGRGRTGVDNWPTDPEWYSSRTQKQIATEMHVSRYTVKNHTNRYGLKCKPSPRHRKSESHD